jgi:hypothetical protein
MYRLGGVVVVVVVVVSSDIGTVVRGPFASLRR